MVSSDTNQYMTVTANSIWEVQPVIWFILISELFKITGKLCLRIDNFWHSIFQLRLNGFVSSIQENNFCTMNLFSHSHFFFYFPYCPACCCFDIFSSLILLANKAQFVNALFQIVIIEFKIGFLSRLALFKWLFWEKLEQIKSKGFLT